MVVVVAAAADAQARGCARNSDAGGEGGSWALRLCRGGREAPAAVSAGGFPFEVPRACVSVPAYIYIYIYIYIPLVCATPRVFCI